MKKLNKRIIIGLGSVTILIVLFFVVYTIKARSILQQMTTSETGEIVENIFSIKDSFVNFYLVKDGDNYIAIDAGNKRSNIWKELKKLNIAPGKISAVFLTHSDGDHVAGLRLFENAGIYLSKQEEQLLNGEKSRFFIFGNKIEAEKYRLIVDQQIVNIGNVKIQGFLTPGHTPGAMCYLVNDSLLFTGDALKLKNGKIEPFDNFFNMDSETASRSIATVLRIPGVRYVLTAHYGNSSDIKKAVQSWHSQ